MGMEGVLGGHELVIMYMRALPPRCHRRVRSARDKTISRPATGEGWSVHLFYRLASPSGALPHTLPRRPANEQLGGVGDRSRHEDSR